MNSNIIVPKLQRALVLQGGGALGAYEVGVIKRLSKKLQETDKKKGTDSRCLFDIVAGTSIGAMNAAVFVSNVVKKKSWTEAAMELERFWKEGIALKEGTASSDDILPIGMFRFFPWWKPWTKGSPRRASSKKDHNDEKNINAKKLASEEAARRYYSAKEFVFKGKKVFSSKEPRPDNKFFDQAATWYMLNDLPL